MLELKQPGKAAEGGAEEVVQPADNEDAGSDDYSYASSVIDPATVYPPSEPPEVREQLIRGEPSRLRVVLRSGCSCAVCLRLSTLDKASRPGALL